ncbi:MAG: transporter substrate-binding domain-containing protein [Opitutae bacterium]|nr:transporter substrate-binding domain-containing protein [Opitutae bacterium]
MTTAFRLGVALRRSLRLAAGMALTLLSARGEPPPPDARVLRAGVETHSDPFTGADAQGRPAGFSVELLRAVARDQGLAVEFVLLPWGQVLADFKAGRIDLICNVVDTPERRAFMEFSVTTTQMKGGLFARRGLRPLRAPADLAGLRLAVQKDSRAHQYVQHQDWNVQLVFVSSLQEAIDAVHEGRGDIFLSSQLVAEYLLQRRGYRDIVDSGMPAADFDYRAHFGVQPGQKKLLARLNDGLLALRLNGTYDRIYEQWLGALQPRTLRLSEIRPYLLPSLALLLLAALAFVWQRRMLAQVSRQARELRLSEERLSLVFEGSQDAFWDWDVRTARVMRSPRWAGMLGYTPGEIGRDRAAFVRLVHPDDLPRIEADEREIWRARDHFALEFRLRAKSGEWQWILDRGKVIGRDPATGAPRRIVGTHSDITARKRAEDESARLQTKLLDSQKLESLGVLAGGIAHDFNNLLTVILGNTTLTRLDPGLAAENAERLGNIQLASNRAADLCRQLLAYAGKGSFSLGRLDLNTVVLETTRLLELSLSRQARLEFALADGLPALDGDSSQLRQMVMNLVLNASESFGANPGLIRVASRLVPLGPGGLPRGLPSGDLPAGAYVCLEISDTGCGMTPPVVERIFDPFFTTKFTGRGLGLAAVLGIVRSHRGALTVASSPGRGSVFQVYLPAASPPPPPRANPAAPPPGTAVLVVEDEAPVRQLVLAVLRRGGFDAVGAADGPEALEIFRADPGRYFLALVDLSLPGMDGPAVLGALRARHPALAATIMSGHHEAAAREACASCGPVDFLQKPFTPDALFRTVARARNLPR